MKRYRTVAFRGLIVATIGFLAIGLAAQVGAQKEVAKKKKAIAARVGGDVPAAAAPLFAAQPKIEGPSPRLMQRLGTDQFRHGSRILCLAYSPNGQILAAGGGSDPVRVWDTQTGQQKFTCNETWINAITFSPRGSLIVTGGAFKAIRLWAAATGKDEGKLDGHTAPVKALALSSDGTLLASGAQDGAIIFWEMLTKKQIIVLKDHTGEVTSLAFSPFHDPFSDRPELMVSGSNDRTVRVWDATQNKVKLKIEAGCGVLAVAISPDEKTVFSAGDDNLIRAWDTETGKLLHTFKGHTGMVVSLAISRDGKSLISGGRDQSIRVWDLQNRDAAPRVIPRHLGDTDALALSKDGARIATAGINNTIRIFETATGKEMFGGEFPKAGLNGLAMSKDGKYIAAITDPGIVYLWDAKAGKAMRAWETGHLGEIAIAFTPDGQSVVTGAESVRFWDPQSGKQRFALPGDDVKMATALSLAFSPDGRLLAIGHRGQSVTLYDMEKKAQIGGIKYSGEPYALGFSVDSKLLAISGSSKIVLWDVGNNKEVRRFECKDAPPKTLLPDVAALAFSPDRRTIAVACFDGVIRMLTFEGNTPGKEVAVCEGHTSVPYAIAFSPDGRTLISGSFDGTARVWEPFSGSPLAELKGHAGPVHGVALSPDGKIGYSASADTTVIVWDASGTAKNPPANAKLGGAELDDAWKDLSRTEAAVARPVVWKLIANSDGVAAYLKTKAPLVDVPRIKKLIADLDSDDFDDRKKAFDELANQGRWLEGRLKEALEKPPSLEYKRRVEDLLNKLAVPGALSLAQEQMRLRRTMMVLEYIADPPSIDLLERLSKQAPEDALCDEARATLVRLGKAPPAKTAGQ